MIATTCALLKNRGMPAHYRGEAVASAVFLLNRALVKDLDDKMSYVAYHGRKPAIDFLKTFGSLGFVKDKRSGLKKLDDQNVSMVFIGYSEGTKACKLLDSSSWHVHTSHNIIFDENRGWKWSSGASGDEQQRSGSSQ
jgi:hypothetical protein